MKIRKLHRMIGLVLLLPMFGWAATGLVFFIKPGYSGAYEILSVKTYPLGEGWSVVPDKSWLEFRCVRTILGDHLIARTEAGWMHLDAKSGQPKGAPSEEEIRRLLADAFTQNPERYGRVAEASEGTARTDTGIEIRIDWKRLSLQQRGRDTDRIDFLYKLHYLQWTGLAGLDRVLGLAGLALLIVLTGFGGYLAWNGRENTEGTE